MRATPTAAVANVFLQLAASRGQRQEAGDQALLHVLLACLASQPRRPARMPAAHRREVTAMFCDIAGFSGLSERVGPDACLRLVTAILECITACVDTEEGSIVDFYGDGVLAMWNAPESQPDHADRACRAALAIQAQLPALTASWSDLLGAPLKVRCTINTGPAVVGNTGTRRHQKYGPMGHTVNVAQRVQSASKFFQLPVVITERTRACMIKPLPTRRLGRAGLQGMSETTELLELYEDAEAGYRGAYEQALRRFESGEWREACLALQTALAPNERIDQASLHLLGRAVECLKNRPTDFKPEWDLR
jgi:adenylate cyclase